MAERYDLLADILPTFKITKPIRLIELFAGYGSQALALKYLGADFEHWKIAEWNYKSFEAYHQIHMPEDITDYSKGKSKEQLVDYLTEKGISSDWDKAMTREKISRKSENELRKIYNSIIATHNLVDISQVKAQDLDIVEQDKYCYIMTYSFPCQDLSLAGLRKGMDRDSDTRSGLLWEVERILKECAELHRMPDVLLMENVPQVHGKDNYENFKLWIKQLVKLGYENYYEDLIATDYGIPQIRNRTFMVSVADAHYDFPKAIKLEKKLKDLLEKEVDEKYYLSERAIKGLEFANKVNEEKGRGFKFEPTDGEGTALTVSAGGNTRATDNYVTEREEQDQITVKLANQGKTITDKADVSTTLMARDYKGFGNQESIGVVEIKRPHGYFPGSVKETDTISTIDSSIDYQHIVIGEKTPNKALKETLAKNIVPEGVTFVDAYNKSLLNNDVAETITTRIDASNKQFIAIKNATKQGYLEGEDGDGVDISSRMEYHRGTVQKEKSQTLTTMGGESQGVIVKNEK